MNIEELLEVERHLTLVAGRIGADDVVADRHYVAQFTDIAGQLLPPRERLLAKFKALDRFLSLIDRAVFERSVASINVELAQGQDDRYPFVPFTAVVDVPNATGRGTTEFSFQRLPDLTETRRRLREIAGEIARDE